ncbi:MAG TPA: hypothetical protein VFE98_05415 [Candidatus Bathyarchaeia archaeon]|nr:hypothetical protein [Candidatus Bathyarchaeia archaeon]
MIRSILRAHREDRKGINTILASLLMVVIVVVASVMVYSWQTGLLSTLMTNPTVGKEALAQDNAAVFTSSTNATLYIRNTGTLAISLQSYYVKDAQGNTYQMINWAGPTINPNTVTPTAVTIGSSCGGCAISGNSFTFNTGYTYTVMVVTSKNNQFSLSITR